MLLRCLATFETFYTPTHLYSVLMGADDSSCVAVVVIIVVAIAEMDGLIVRLCDGLCLV